jgi:hypothetical protein
LKVFDPSTTQQLNRYEFSKGDYKNANIMPMKTVPFRFVNCQTIKGFLIFLEIARAFFVQFGTLLRTGFADGERKSKGKEGKLRRPSYLTNSLI